MRVKKFEAKSMKDALRMVKSELGPDAVILGARENKRSFGLAGESSFEVTAAVSEATLQKKQFTESRLKEADREKFRVSDARMQKRMIERMVEKRLMERGNTAMGMGAQARPVDKPMGHEPRATAGPRPITKINYIDIQDEAPVEPTQVYARRPQRPVVQGGMEVVSAAPPRARATAQAAERAAVPAQAQARVETRVPTADVRGKIRNLAREAWEAGRPVEPAKPKQTEIARSAHAAGPASAEIDSLKSEIQRLQTLIEGFQKVPQTFQGASHPGSEYGLSYDFSRSYQKLVESGLSSELAGEILTRASQEIDPINAKKPAIVEAWVAKWFLQNISICARPLSGKMHVFVGPMGSGKTSHLVKTAAQLVIRDKKRIAIVSTDTTKVGAVDQLKIYCQILNVPFAVIRDKSEWAWLESQLQNVD
ncbi:MAG: hypothetical protein RBT63_04905, partial [Bdellovibrionales bacterium]|nr:hypothetical protein [Bdellovibrionales bacterium]